MKDDTKAVEIPIWLALSRVGFSIRLIWLLFYLAILISIECEYKPLLNWIFKQYFNVIYILGW